MNLIAARKGKQFGSANGALELIGRVTGLLGGKHQEPQVPITRVTIVLNHGADAEGNSQIVEGSYRRALSLPMGIGSKETRQSCPFLDFDYCTEFLYQRVNGNLGKL